MEIKKCPFCGSTPIVEYGNGIKKWWVCCRNDKCWVHPTTDAHTNKSVVVRFWNRRVDDGRED